MNQPHTTYDVLVIGAGPSGLPPPLPRPALVLAYCW